MRIVGALRMYIYNELYSSPRILKELSKPSQKEWLKAVYQHIRGGGLDPNIILILTRGLTLEQMDEAVSELISSTEDVIIRQNYSTQIIKQL